MSLFLSVWNLGVYTTQFYLTWDDQNQLIKQTKKETSTILTFNSLVIHSEYFRYKQINLLI